MYQIYFSTQANKFLNKLDDSLQFRIKKKLRELGEKPITKDSSFVGRDEDGRKIFKRRIGNYRAIYVLEDNSILITKINKRPRIYHR